MRTNYYINKDSKTGEIVYLEYNKKGYQVKPKVKQEDAIEVNKIVFVSPTLTEKLLKKKINGKISKLLLELNTFYDEDEDSSSEGAMYVRNYLKEAERLKLNIINNYRQYLDGNYVGLTLKKLQVIIDGFHSRLGLLMEKKQKQLFMEMMNGQNYYFEEDTKRGKGR